MPQPIVEPSDPRQAEAAPEEEIPQPALPKLEEGGRLDLVCVGAGAATKLDQITSYGSFDGDIHSYGTHLGSVSGSTSSTTTVTRRDEFGDLVALFIEGEAGRLKMPRIMLPPIRGGEDGWFKLKNIQIKPNEITASISVNPFNNPKLRLDRYAGTISINGKAGDYAGVCKRIIPEALEPAF